MLFWSFLLLCNMLLPLIMIFAGRMMRKHCPKEINGVYGYRTRRSRLNRDTWQFAHAYCGRLWLRAGMILLILTVLLFLPFMRSAEKTVGIIGLIPCIVQGIVMMATVLLTEGALKRTFTDEGIRR